MFFETVRWVDNATGVPKGWKLCDGNNGTPDLRDKFVMGAGPKHAAKSNAAAVKTILGVSRYAQTSTKVLTNYMPAYYALAYIMRTDSYCCICVCTRTKTIHSNTIPLVGQAPGSACTSHCNNKARPEHNPRPALCGAHS